MGIMIQAIVPEKNLFFLKDKDRNILFKNIDCGLNSALWFKITEDKELTYILLAQEDIPVPQSRYIRKKESKDYNYENLDIRFPLVVKPVDGAHGDGVIVDIRDILTLKRATENAFDLSESIIIQNFVSGEDHRIIVVWEEVVAVAKREPASITWDGIHTISELVEEENKNPLRGFWDHSNPLSPIKFDNESVEYIKKLWLFPESIPAEWVHIFLRGNANLSTGWKAIDLTDQIHPDTKAIAIRATKILNLQVAWVDILTTDISKPLSETGWVIIEVNATPGLRMHHFPSVGSPRNPAKAIINLRLS